MEYGDSLLTRLKFSREMLDDKLSEISEKEKEVKTLKKEVSSIVENISKIELTLIGDKNYYCGACCYLESKCNKGKYKCLETGEYKKYHCKACEKFRDLPF